MYMSGYLHRHTVWWVFHGSYTNTFKEGYLVDNILSPLSVPWWSCLRGISTLHEHTLYQHVTRRACLRRVSKWRGLNVDGGWGQGWVEWWRWIKSAFWIDTHPSSISHLSLSRSILVCILSKSSKWSTRDRWLVNIGQYANAQLPDGTI